VIFTAVMAWTQSELDQVRAAVLALATGARVVTVSYAGPPARSVTYGAAELQQLRDLLAEMERAVSSPTRYRRVGFSKGFYSDD
jgi:hypothetical protein